MKVIYKFFAALALVVSVSACDLNLEPTGTVTYDDPYKLFDTYSRAGQFANGLNAYFRGIQQGLYCSNSEIQGDMFNADSQFGNNGGPLHTMNTGFTPADYDTQGFWDGVYNVVNKCNSYLVNCGNVKTDELSASQVADLEQWKAQALFYRAYAFHQLATHFCADYEPATAAVELGLPIVLAPDIDSKPVRSSLEETYAIIVADIEAAKSLMHIEGEIASYVPTVDALNALDARVQLDLHNYSEAYAAAEKVIAGPYALSTNYDELNAEFYTQTGTETILRSFTSLAEGGSSNTGMFLSYYGDLSQYGPEYAEVYTATFIPNARLLGLYAKGDIRYDVFFEPLTAVCGGYIVGGMPLFTKFKGNPELGLNDYYSGSTMPRVMALPEMYLIAAEAAAQSGNEGNAKTMLNALQSARNAAETDGSMDNIKNEWAKETVGEGFRIQCLKRWHDGFENRPAVPELEGYLMTGNGFTEIYIPADYYKFVWPIPTYQIQTNLNLEQNTGWDAI